MKFRIDYHFHPNISQNNEKAILKCKKSWANFKNNNINCVIVTEHSYKDPERAYKFMLKTMPRRKYCFPGMEYITKEGIDLVVFSYSEDIYRHQLLKPFRLSYFEVIDYVRDNHNLFAFVTHPYTLGLTSVIKILNHEKYKMSVDLLGAVEISNGAFDNLTPLLTKFPFCFLFKSKLDNIKKTQNLPKEDYPKRINFLAVGSDAHYVEDIGNNYAIDYNEKKKILKNKAFEIVINNKGKAEVCIRNKKFSILHLLKTGITSLNEFMIKNYLRYKLNVV